MFDWLFGTVKVANQYSRKVYVNSSRHPTKVFTIYGDTEVCAIRAMKEVELQLPKPEPGETVEIKTYLGRQGERNA
ncbi:hypothetical protein QUB05_07500 [Microcoleus sp. F10-C6]|uniref:hypothetical protein n=1 Tax=unclassified Microcoleus TaxID=2642155 RepID=UPI002FD074CA